MEHPQVDEPGSINRRDAAAVLAQYAAWLDEQPLSARTREAYLAAVTAFAGWLSQREGGVGDALLAPRARDLAARDYKRYMKVDRGLAAASVNQALASMDHLFRFASGPEWADGASLSAAPPCSRTTATARSRPPWPTGRRTAPASWW